MSGGQGIGYFLTESIKSDSLMFNTAVQKIAKMTDNNDANGAAIAGAELMNKVAKGRYKKILEIFKHLQAIHKLEGSMPYELGQYRHAYLKQMWKEAKIDLDAKQYEQFYGAF